MRGVHKRPHFVETAGLEYVRRANHALGLAQDVTCAFQNFQWALWIERDSIRPVAKQVNVERRLGDAEDARRLFQVRIEPRRRRSRELLDQVRRVPFRQCANYVTEYRHAVEVECASKNSRCQ